MVSPTHALVTPTPLTAGPASLSRQGNRDPIEFASAQRIANYSNKPESNPIKPDVDNASISVSLPLHKSATVLTHSRAIAASAKQPPGTLLLSRDQPSKRRGRQPGPNLSTDEKASLLADLDAHHPPKKQAADSKGKLLSQATLVKDCALKPHKDGGLCAKAHFDDVSVMLVNGGFLADKEKRALKQVNPLYEVMVPCVEYLKAQ